MTRVTVLGLGYLGTTHAACMAELGFEVLGVDSDPERVSALAVGKSPFFEPGLNDLVAQHVATGRLRVTQSLAEAAEFGDVHFICVGTPQRRGGYEMDLRAVAAVVEGICPHISCPALLVGKSTVPVGTADRLTARVRQVAPAGAAVEVAWNPEFLREGSAIADTLHPNRIILGVASASAERILRSIYQPISDRDIPVIVTDLATAELSKLAANAFLATKISFINAMAEICEASGADVRQLSTVLSHDPRIGNQFITPGLGFGGGCLPKDLRALIACAEGLGSAASTAFLVEIDRINARRRQRTVDLARELCGGALAGKRVALWGAAFKPNSDDIRDSPALAVAESVRAEGAEVTVYDPRANDNARKLHPFLTYAEDPVDAAVDADVLVHATEWDLFRDMDPRAVGQVVAGRRVVDGRGTLDPSRWRDAGWTYRALGEASAPIATRGHTA